MQKQQLSNSSKGSFLLPLVLNAKLWQIVVICLIVLHFLTLSAFMLARVAALHTPTYDHGLFTQMFHYMLKTSLPLTTLERDMLLSHFKVHISPIYYLYLPFFALWKSAYCLELLQIVTVLLALIPLGKLLKYVLELRTSWRYTVYLLYVYAPAITGANFYDLHENCFLPLCLFSLLLANWQRNKLQVLLWTILTLAIKEDAMLYVVCIGAYFACRSFANYYKVANKAANMSEPNYSYGCCSKDCYVRLKQAGKVYLQEDLYYFIWQIVLPLCYFAIAIYYLNQFGQGAMTNRFANLLLPGQKGLFCVLTNFILHPYFVFSQILTKDKLMYLLTIMLALALLPLRQRHVYNYILFAPLVVMNLLSNYPYQHSLTFQYNYGSSALLVYLLALSLANWQTKLSKLDEAKHVAKKLFLQRYVQTLLTIAVVVSLSVTSHLLGQVSYSFKSYLAQTSELQLIKAKLGRIPRDKRLLADTFLTTYLADASELYDIGYHNGQQVDATIDYVVAYRQVRSYNEIVNNYRKLGYVEVRELSSDKLLVLRRN